MGGCSTTSFPLLMNWDKFWGWAGRTWSHREGGRGKHKFTYDSGGGTAHVFTCVHSLLRAPICICGQMSTIHI